MKKFLPLLMLLFLGNLLSAQTFTGQWKGRFVDNSSSLAGFGGESCDYVLELEVNGNEVTGYSYTYFYEPGKKYYTICRLKGFIKKGSKYVEVRETERTKTNVPIHIRNCFQVHRLTFFKQGNEETLEGNWIPAPNQDGDCGFGTTQLSRRVMQANYPSFNKKATPLATAKPTPKLPDLRDNNKRAVTPPPVAKSSVAPAPKPKTATPKTVAVQPQMKNNEIATLPITAEKVEKQSLLKKTNTPGITDSRYEKRNKNLIRTIEVENEAFTVDLYDNGDIDGDSISVFYNNKLIVNHKRLTDRAITITLNADNNTPNELVMYAENLGTIPPNTALMVVHDGDNRYEVRISSDNQKSGAIRFVHKPKTQ